MPKTQRSVSRAERKKKREDNMRKNKRRNVRDDRERIRARKESVKDISVVRMCHNNYRRVSSSHTTIKQQVVVNEQIVQYNDKFYANFGNYRLGLTSFSLVSYSV